MATDLDTVRVQLTGVLFRGRHALIVAAPGGGPVDFAVGPDGQIIEVLTSHGLRRSIATRRIVGFLIPDVPTTEDPT